MAAVKNAGKVLATRKSAFRLRIFTCVRVNIRGNRPWNHLRGIEKEGLQWKFWCKVINRRRKKRECELNSTTVKESPRRVGNRSRGPSGIRFTAIVSVTERSRGCGLRRGPRTPWKVINRIRKWKTPIVPAPRVTMNALTRPDQIRHQSRLMAGRQKSKPPTSNHHLLSERTVTCGTVIKSPVLSRTIITDIALHGP